jgi:hypothetical protein
MKKYLIRIETGRNAIFTTINGDSRRPFQILNNLWNYTTPGHAARRLEKHAQQWENGGRVVNRIYGTVADMPTQGDDFNLEMILLDYNPKTRPEDYRNLIRKHYHY